MTITTQEVFDKHEVRKTKEQRAEFRKFVQRIAENEGYDCVVENSGGNAHNIIVGSPKEAKVVFTAHYDTCATTPFPNFITPKSIYRYILYQLFICLCIYTVPVLMITLVPSLILKWTGSGSVAVIFFLLGYVALFLSCFLLIAGPANKHSANDNTSGVSVLLDLMHEMPGEYREDVAFIFFDLEERGCVGSQSYRKRHARDMKKKPVINFDCVGDGKNMILVVKKDARPYVEMLSEAFASTDTINVEVSTKGAFFPSDQRSFERGVGVGAFKMHDKGYLYLDRIHTKFDTKFDEENIEYLVNSSIKLIENWDYEDEPPKTISGIIKDTVSTISSLVDKIKSKNSEEAIDNTEAESSEPTSDSDPTYTEISE